MAKYEIKDGVGIISEGTTTIEIYAFDSEKKLTSIVIPKTVTGIGKYACSCSKGLTNIVILDSVTKIDCGILGLVRI